MSTHLKTPVHEILHYILADDDIGKVAYLKISGEKQII